MKEFDDLERFSGPEIADMESRENRGYDWLKDSEVFPLIAEMEAKILRLETEADRLADWIHHYQPKIGSLDYACEQCNPGAEIVRKGFVCTYHTAEKRYQEGLRKIEIDRIRNRTIQEEGL